MNAGLGAVVVRFMAEKPAVVEVRVPVPVVTVKKSATAPKFQWSQLESTDYLIYARNLREIGCPEQTIRDIIQADLASLYDGQRRALAGANLTAAQQQAYLQKLEGEQQSVLAGVLGKAGVGGSAPGMNQTASTATPEAAPQDLRQARFDRAMSIVRTLPVPQQVVQRVGDILASSLVNNPAEEPATPAAAPGGKSGWTQEDQQIRTLLGYANFSAYQRQMRASQ